MNRRGFFSRLLGAAAAVVGIKAATPYLDAADPETGISIRYIKNWDASHDADCFRYSVISANAHYQHLFNQKMSEEMEALEFYSGDSWIGRRSKWNRLTVAQRRFNPARLPA